MSEDNSEDTVRIPTYMIPAFRAGEVPPMSADWAAGPARLPPPVVIPLERFGDTGTLPAVVVPSETDELPPVVESAGWPRDTGALTAVVSPTETGPLPSARPSFDTGSLPRVVLPTETGPLPPVVSSYDTGPLPPVVSSYDTGPLPPVVASSGAGPLSPVVSPSETGPLRPVVASFDTGPLPRVVAPFDTGSLPPVVSSTETGPLPPVVAPFDTGSLPPVVSSTETGPLRPVVAPFDTGPIPPVVAPAVAGPLPPLESSLDTGPLPAVVASADRGGAGGARPAVVTSDDTQKIPPVATSDDTERIPAVVTEDDTGVMPMVADDDTARILATRASRSLPVEIGADQPVEVWPQRATRSFAGREVDEEAPAEAQRHLVVPALSVLAAVAVVVGAAMFADRIPSPAPQPAAQQATRSSDLSCAGAAAVPGTVFGTASGDASWQPSGGTANAVQGFFQQAVTGPSRLSGSGSLAGVVQYSRAGQVATIACSAPSATGYLQIGSAEATLVLANIDAVDAVLNVALLGPDGVIATPDLVDLKVTADTSLEIDIGKYVSGAAPVTARWQSTQGRVVATARIDTANGFDLVSPTDSATQIVVPGVPGGTVSVMLANFSTNRAKASIDVLTKDGRVPAAGADGLTVESNSSTFVDLTNVLAGQTAALLINSDQPIIASAWVSSGSDVATSPGVPATQLAAQTRLGVATGAGTLVVSNAGRASAHVKVTLTVDGKPNDQALEVGAGVTSTVPMTAAGVVKVEAPADVVAALVLPSDGSGLTIVQLPSDTARTGTTPVWSEAQPVT